MPDAREVLGFADKPLFLISGPCVIESKRMCLEVGRVAKAACDEHGLGYVFKASFDKANRSSGHSFRGPGLDEGAAILREVRDELGAPTCTDVHLPEQAELAGSAADVLQIPAFLARQTDLLQACARHGRVVNIKKGQFMAPEEMGNAADKVAAAGEAKVMLCERGTFFGYGRLVNDFAGLRTMAGFGHPVVFDATHSTQRPAGLGTSSGGDASLAPILARAAVAAGVNGLFLEAHPDPANAKSDAASQMKLDDLAKLVGELAALAKLRATW